MPSWGIAWYVNDLLIPEITVERGLTYEFIIEGGNDPSQPARYVSKPHFIGGLTNKHLFENRYHPFYITDSPEGGLGQKMGLEARKQKAYAGVEYDEDGNAIPTGGESTSRLCHFKL